MGTKINKAIQNQASHWLSFFEKKERNNGDKFWCLKDDRPEPLYNAVHQAHKNSSDLLPNDWSYQFIITALNTISEYNGQDFEEAIGEIEPSIYTHDLTNWLASNNNRVFYLTQALEEMEFKDGSQLLMFAQGTEQKEVAFSILNSLKTYLGIE